MRAFAKNAYAFMLDVYDGFSRDNGGLIAAAVGFYTFLSLVPILVLAVAILGYVLGSRENAQEVVLSYVKQYSPAVARETSLGIRDVVSNVVSGRGSATWFGVLLLVWTGSSLMAQLETSINLAWGVERSRGFVARRLTALALLALVGALLGASIGVTALFAAVRSRDIRVFGLAPSEWSWLWQLVGYALPVAVSICAFTLVYKVLPNARVRLRTALVGGVFAGVMWDLAKVGYGYYVTHYADLGKVYGSLGAVVLLLVWINYSAVITILGAEVASQWERRHVEVGGKL